MQLEFAEVVEAVCVFGLLGAVETEVESGCFGRGGSLGRMFGVGVERVQH
jgi:hypothetical protein